MSVQYKHLFRKFYFIVIIINFLFLRTMSHVFADFFFQIIKNILLYIWFPVRGSCLIIYFLCIVPILGYFLQKVVRQKNGVSEIPSRHHAFKTKAA